MKNYFFLLKSFLFGKCVGTDQFGNAYYCHRRNSSKRWVVYKGNPEATKIPPHWYSWIHGFTQIPLNYEDAYSWQKKHHPNLTGTLKAHKPCDTTLKAKHRTGYTPWRP